LLSSKIYAILLLLLFVSQRVSFSFSFTLFFLNSISYILSAAAAASEEKKVM
jgi:hypothetical protein